MYNNYLDPNTKLLPVQKALIYQIDLTGKTPIYQTDLLRLVLVKLDTNKEGRGSHPKKDLLTFLGIYN